MTNRSKLAMIYAKRYALGTGSEKIEPLHLLLGLIAVKEGVAATVLREFGFNEKVFMVIAGVEYNIDLRQESHELPHNLNQVFDESVQLSANFGHVSIGTEHLLLALISKEEGEIAKLIIKSGISPAQIRNRTVELLTAPEEVDLIVAPIVLHFGNHEILLSPDFFLTLLEVSKESGGGVLIDQLFVDVLKARLENN